VSTTTQPHHRSKRLPLSGATAKHRLGHLEQGALILAATVATYVVWLSVGLPGLPFQIPGLPRIEQEAPFAVHVDEATPPRTRPSPLKRKPARKTLGSITPVGRNRTRTRPRSSGPTGHGSLPPATEPRSNPPTAAPQETPTASPHDRQPTPTEVRNDTPPPPPPPPITDPTLPDVPPLPPPLPDIPLPQIPPLPALPPEAPELPRVPEPSQPVQTPTLPSLPVQDPGLLGG
jgi:hypothetical protein